MNADEVAPALPGLPADATDPATARMCAETGHVCIMCPEDVRHLYAVAHNAVGAAEAALAGVGSRDRAQRKLAELRRVVDDARKVTDMHFAALEKWRRR